MQVPRIPKGSPVCHDEATIRTLTSAMASGEPGAIARFYDEYFHTMFQEARKASHRDEQFCLDVVQDAMLKIIRSIKPVDTHQQLLHWARLVVRNAAYDQIRSEIRRRRREATSASCSIATPEARDLEELEEQLEWLETELASLPRSSWHLLNARYNLGWTLERIGRELGISTGAVDGRIRRLIAALRQNHKRDHDD